uniref:H15 domain-containing protein n=1 Tax=Kalanchoe fedtschenkoi TaxID=63787 RepID=A0A7N1A4U2_KALFE
MAVDQKAIVVAKEKKPKSHPAHPPYLVMIQDAIQALKERTGSSQYAIAKHIEEKQASHLPQNFKKLLLVQLKKLVANGKLVKVKQSFKLAPALKPSVAATKKPKPKPVAERKAKAAAAASKSKVMAAKPKPKAKVVAGKPKTVADSKPKAKVPVKAKAAVKPNAKAAKPTTAAANKATKVAKTASITSPGKKNATKPKKVAVRRPKSIKSPVKKAPKAKK